MMLTIEKLQEILPDNDYIEEWYPVIVDTLPGFNIDSPERMAAFLSQCSHESGGFKRIVENLNYHGESLRKVFSKYFPTDEIAKQYEHKPEKIANRVYANRMGNGSENSGDGWRYKGRGLIQITGKNNYQSFSDYMEMSIEDIPDYLETFEGALISACWYWEANKLNEFADKEDIKGLTRKINGGYNGLQDRIDKYNEIIEILS